MKHKKCKGTGKAKGFEGCGTLQLMRKYGLGVNCGCFKQWVMNTPEGGVYLKNNIIPSAKRKVVKDKKAEAKEKKKERWKADKTTFYNSSAWKWFRQFVKLYYANRDGLVRCSTSGILYNLNDEDSRKNLDAGHYIKVFNSSGATNFSTAFMLSNCAPQAANENRFGGGSEEKMKAFLIKKWGKEDIENMIFISKKPMRLDKWTMEEISDNWRCKYKKLVEQRGLDPFKK